MTVINIIFTMLLVLLVVGLSVGFACANPSNYAYYSYYYYSGTCMILVVLIFIIDHQLVIFNYRMLMISYRLMTINYKISRLRMNWTNKINGMVTIYSLLWLQFCTLIKFHDLYIITYALLRSIITFWHNYVLHSKIFLRKVIIAHRH